jgi:hypothetical protein
MSMSAKREQALLQQDEIGLLRTTHHPGIYGLDRKELSDMRSRLRDMRGKAKTVARQKQREARGKADARGRSFPGSADQPLMRKQLFAAALKRVNKEIVRLDQMEAKARHVEAAHRAFAQLRAAQFETPSPAPQRTKDKGMQPVESTKRRRVLPRGKVGSVLKQNKIAQAIRDARPG